MSEDGSTGCPRRGPIGGQTASPQRSWRHDPVTSQFLSRGSETKFCAHLALARRQLAAMSLQVRRRLLCSALSVARRALYVTHTAFGTPRRVDDLLILTGAHVSMACQFEAAYHAS